MCGVFWNWNVFYKINYQFSTCSQAVSPGCCCCGCCCMHCMLIPLRNEPPPLLPRNYAFFIIIYTFEAQIDARHSAPTLETSSSRDAKPLLLKSAHHIASVTRLPARQKVGMSSECYGIAHCVCHVHIPSFFLSLWSGLGIPLRTATTHNCIVFLTSSARELRAFALEYVTVCSVNGKRNKFQVNITQVHCWGTRIY